MKKPKSTWLLLFLSGMAWSVETDEEIIRYLDFYQNLEILSDKDAPSLEDLDEVDPKEKT
ncbi:MAG: hypothetical protein JNL01_09155 [Bdellovibrionales bacterium]|nr:hypothetical protein [Bdellovibrionales bacterium]